MNTTNIISEKCKIVHIRTDIKDDYFNLAKDIREYYFKNDNYFRIMVDIEQNVYFF